MKIVIARHSGFCMGVRIAMNTLMKNVHTAEGPIETLGPLIHNPQTMDLLKKKNVRAVGSPGEVTAGTVAIRTHGVPPGVRAEIDKTGVRVIDATCPHVKRIHTIIDAHHKKGFDILIFGDADHAEVTGLMGFARDKGHVIRSEADVRALPDLPRACLVAQTTQSLRQYQRIKSAVHGRFPDAKIFDTICRATDRRQNEVERLARETDAVVVVGGKNSANSTRLANIAREHNRRVHHIETESELRPADFTGLKRVAVVSGASTPSWLLSRVTERLKEIALAQHSPAVRLVFSLFRALIHFNVFLALGAALMTYTAADMQSHPQNLLHMITAALYINSMYILNRLTNIRANQYEEIFKMDFLLRHRRVSVAICAVTGALSMALAWRLGLPEFVLVVLAGLLGVLYHINILPKNDLPFLRHRRLKDIALSKDVGISLAWAVVCVFALYLEPFRKFPGGDTIFAFAFVFIMVFIRTIFHDLHDLQRDRIVGRETLPIVLGRKFRTYFPYPVLAVSALVPLLGAVLHVLPAHSFLLVLCPFYLWFVYRLLDAGRLADTLLFDFTVDFMLVLPFILLTAGRMLLV
jgi:4-hydroxy-3-methylbut-2-enyl diphosphate reductase